VLLGTRAVFFDFFSRWRKGPPKKSRAQALKMSSDDSHQELHLSPVIIPFEAWRVESEFGYRQTLCCLLAKWMKTPHFFCAVTSRVLFKSML
jgi:hypothetical protein